jgi:Domain of unknown function (DUF2017)
VKLIERDGESFLFHISKREKGLLFEVLKLYPLIPIAHHRVSQAAATPSVQETQKLLESALADRTRENKRQLLAMLNQEARLQETDGAQRLMLSAPQMEWLLQVLNDIRVGSWLILGEPDEKKGKPIEVNDENARYYAAMEFCGLFQMTLLDAFQQSS